MEGFLFKTSKPNDRMSPMDHESEAERNLILGVEERRATARRKKGDWDAAVDGESPPLARVPMTDSSLFPVSQTSKVVPDLLHGVMKQFKIKMGGKASSKKAKSTTSSSYKQALAEKGRYEVPMDRSADIFTSFRFEKADRTFSSHVDNLVESAILVNQMFEKDSFNESELDTMDETQPLSYMFEKENSTEPLLPVTSTDVEAFPFRYGATGDSTQDMEQKKMSKKGAGVGSSQKSMTWCLPRSHFGLAEILNSGAVIQGLLRFLFASLLPFVILPSVLTAALLYYHMGNPSIGFLPGDASLSWWLLFIARQALVLEFVRAVEHVAVEGIALRTRWMVFVSGPLVTLWFINAKGWPLISILWSLTDLGILHGDHPFQQNWFFFLHIDLFSSANPGGDVLKSDFYLRVLLSVLLAGTCHAIKRTYVAMEFGRRIFLTYQTSLEQILADGVLIEEVAALASEVDLIEGTPLTRAGRVRGMWRHALEINYKTSVQKGSTREAFNNLGESSAALSPHEDIDSDPSMDGDGEISEVEEDNDSATSDCGLEVAEDTRKGGQESISSVRGDNVPARATEMQGEELTRARHFAGVVDAMSVQSSESLSQLKGMLDRWQEPQNKLDKPVEVSISDILKFRKALALMENPFLFGVSFGPCETRDQVIKSAKKTYGRLLRKTDLAVLKFDVIKLLALDEQHNLDEGKNRALKRLFRPDKQEELTLLGFVHTCDAVYRKVRFFRASVGNASVINKVLESIIDGIVNFVLFLVIMTILEYNPYPILVSLSTLMVSFAFALGSSASKYIEGVLLIAFRRPFDIGDRIVIAQPAQDETEGVSQSWFVEDINLWCTTLRFATTNEVAVLNNGALSGLRIVNCNRSPNALISMMLDFDLKKVDQQKMNFFQQELEQFIRERPLTFDTLIFFRCEHIDTNKELIQYSVRVRHMRSWQDAAVVLHSRGELLWFSIKLGNELGINKAQLPIQVATICDATTSKEVADAADIIAAIGGGTTKAAEMAVS